jgi:membrane protein YqaA with SNARE-associated domain
MSGGWQWVAFGYATSAVVLGGYLWYLLGRTAQASRRRRELG